jgi:hypothetical protein
MMVRETRVKLDLPRLVCRLSEMPSVSIEGKKKILDLACLLLNQAHFKMQYQFYDFFYDQIRYHDKNYMTIFMSLFKKSFKTIVKISNKITDHNFDAYYKQVLKNKAGAVEDLQNTHRYEKLDLHVQFCCLLIGFFQLLCSNSFQPMQKFLLTQQDPPTAFDTNAIKIITNVLKETINYSHFGCNELTLKVLEFLIEVVRGPCRENQEELSKLNIEELCLKMMVNNSPGEKYPLFHNFNQKGFEVFFMKMERLCFQLLYYQLEGNKSREYLKRLADIFGFQLLFSKMQHLHSLISAGSISDNIIERFIEKKQIPPEHQTLENAVEIGFNAFYLAKYIDFATGAFKPFIADLNESDAKVYQYFDRRLWRIEVNFKDKIELIYFVAPQNIIRLYTHATFYIEQINKDSYYSKLTETIRNVG